MKFRKKSVEIEAMNLDEYGHALVNWLVENRVIFKFSDGGIEISTLEGISRAERGDWIIKNAKNEFYSCKPDIFEITYEPVL